MTIIYLLIANTVAHVASFLKLKSANDSNANGVLGFAFINAIIAIFMWQGFDWSKWLALAFPLIGGSALLFTTILKGKGTLIDYIILLLDIAIIALVATQLI